VLNSSPSNKSLQINKEIKSAHRIRNSTAPRKHGEASKAGMLADGTAPTGALRRTVLCAMSPLRGGIQHEPENKPTSTQRIREAIDRVIAESRQKPEEHSSSDQDDPPATHQP
jgi:hypothetical protein